MVKNTKITEKKKPVAKKAPVKINKVEKTKTSTKKMITPVQAVVAFFRNTFDFQSRASRSEFWWVVLFVVLLNTIVSPFAWMNYVISLLLIIPMLSLKIRRLHDIGLSGWFLALFFFLCFSGLLLSAMAMAVAQIEGVLNYTQFMIGVWVTFVTYGGALILFLLPSKKNNKYNETGIKLW